MGLGFYFYNLQIEVINNFHKIVGIMKQLFLGAGSSEAVGIEPALEKGPNAASDGLCWPRSPGKGERLVKVLRKWDYQQHSLYPGALPTSLPLLLLSFCFFLGGSF